MFHIIICKNNNNGMKQNVTYSKYPFELSHPLELSICSGSSPDPVFLTPASSCSACRVVSLVSAVFKMDLVLKLILLTNETSI